MLHYITQRKATQRQFVREKSSTFVIALMRYFFSGEWMCVWFVVVYFALSPQKEAKWPNGNGEEREREKKGHYDNNNESLKRWFMNSQNSSFFMVVCYLFLLILSSTTPNNFSFSSLCVFSIFGFFSRECSAFVYSVDCVHVSFFRYFWVDFVSCS